MTIPKGVVRRPIRRWSTRLALALLPLLVAACAVPVTATDPNATTPSTATTASNADAIGASSAPIVTPLAAQIAAAAPAVESAPAPTPVDPLRPDVLLNLNDRAAQTDLWVRVRRGFAVPDLDTELVRKSEQWYANRPDYVQRMTDRGGRYLFHIVEELDRRHMPTELALLPFIESAFNPQAMSTARASGMWQFIPGTGRDYALKQNLFRDDRRDVLASTRAALDYLQRLYGLFGDWQLALAGYNWGEGNVQRAIARNQAQGLPTDYLSLRMPSETQNYYPKLQAVKNIVTRPADFGLTLPALRNHPYFASVPIERDMDVKVAAQLAGIPLDEFQNLNPQMNKPVILASGTPQVLLPYDNAALFVEQLPKHRGPLATWTAWTVPKTMRAAEAADALGMDELQLREINRIPARMLVKAGSTLLVPRTENHPADVPVEVADNATMALSPDVPPLRKLAVRAGRRETVGSLARRYRLDPAQVAQWNGVSTGAALRPGQNVVVYLSNAAVATRARASRPMRLATVIEPPRAARGSEPAARTIHAATAAHETAHETAHATAHAAAQATAAHATAAVHAAAPTRGTTRTASTVRAPAPVGHPSTRASVVGAKLRARLART